MTSELLTIFIASDHAGKSLKEQLIKTHVEYEWKDLNHSDEATVGYPDHAQNLCKNIQKDTDRGVLVCGSGIGMAIAANRFSHIRAVQCTTSEEARLARQHNHVNVLCLGERLTPNVSVASDILNTFMKTKADQSDRHQRRVSKLSQ